MRSVCLACHNGEDFLRRQILSILPQLSAEDELLIGDDGSSDGSLEVVQGIGDSRIRVWSESFGGVMPNFEFLLRQARGEWILLSDQDDEWLPGRVALLDEVPDHAWLALCDAQVVDGEGRELRPSLFRARNARPGYWHNLWRNGYTGCCMALRRPLLRHVLPFPAGIGMHDWWIGLTAERLGRSWWSEKRLVRHFRHGRNATSGLEKSRIPRRLQIAMRLRLLWETGGK